MLLQLRYIGLLFLIHLSCLNGLSQITVNNNGVNVDANYLVNTVLRGPGTDTELAFFNGNIFYQIGRFDDPLQSIGLKKGVILCTGNVHAASSQNISDSLTNPLFTFGQTSDPDMIMLAGTSNIHDGAFLEFDVVPVGDKLYLEFVFASEEYPEYVCSDLSDVVGIFISGPGITGPFAGGAENIAIVPGTTMPVGLNSVNNGTPGIFGVSGGCGTAGLGNSNYFITNTGTQHEFDGYTTKLTAVADVQCNQSYHIKIALTDVGGFGSESAIFLNRGGLYSSGIGVERSYVMGDTAIAESCRPDTIKFLRPVAGYAETINLNISGSAINGIDYTTIPPTVNFGVNDTVAYVIIEALSDAMTEGPENVLISFNVPSLCGGNNHYEFETIILDHKPVQLDFVDNFGVCVGDSIFLNATASGGYPPLGYNWGDSASNAFYYVPAIDTTIVLAVYDNAGCGYYGVVDVDVHSIPVVNAGADFTLCQNESATLGIDIDGGSNATYSWSPAIYLNSPNIPYPTISDPVLSTNYTVTVTSDFGCQNSDDVKITTLIPPTVDAGPNQSIIYYQTTAQLTGTGFGMPEWSPSDGLFCINCWTSTAQPAQSTTYYLTTYASNGCKATDSVFVEVIVPTNVWVPTGFSPNGDGYNDLLYVRGYTISYMTFQIFDQWGNVVFESSDPTVGWDGTSNGQPAMQGVYTYVASVVFINNAGTRIIGGEITLVR